MGWIIVFFIFLVLFIVDRSGAPSTNRTANTLPPKITKEEEKEIIASYNENSIKPVTEISQDLSSLIKEKKASKNTLPKKDNTPIVLTKNYDKYLDNTDKNNLVVTLTPERYLNGVEEVQKIKVLNSLIEVPLDIFHEDNNLYDNKALLISVDNVNIGYIVKYNTNDAVDKFCFDGNIIKRSIRLKWDGGSFVLFFNKEKQKSNYFVEEFNRYNVTSLWHMTHKDNVKSIFMSGIFSNTQAVDLVNPVDISDAGVQSWRESVEPIYGRKIHDYTPTYFNIKNPMLYVRKDIQDELCLLEISISVLSDDNFIFTDGNAAARNTNFYSSISDIEKIPWEVLNAEYWNDFEDGKRKRCAEMLIYPKIEAKYIKQIHCYSDDTCKKLSNLNCKITTTKKLFF